MDDARTVAELLGLSLEHEPETYVVGSEPAERPPAPPPRRRASPLDRNKIAPFYEAAKAGVPDAYIAKAADVTVSQVAGWRRRLGILRKPGATLEGRLRGTLLVAIEDARRGEGEPRPRETVPADDPIVRDFLRRAARTGFVERCSTLHRRPR